MSPKPVNLIDEKFRVRELITKMDSAMAGNDYEMAWAVFQLVDKHMRRFANLAGVK